MNFRRPLANLRFYFDRVPLRNDYVVEIDYGGTVFRVPSHFMRERTKWTANPKKQLLGEKDRNGPLVS